MGFSGTRVDKNNKAKSLEGVCRGPMSPEEEYQSLLFSLRRPGLWGGRGREVSQRKRKLLSL
jgi:hypothetical protein